MEKMIKKAKQIINAIVFIFGVVGCTATFAILFISLHFRVVLMVGDYMMLGVFTAFFVCLCTMAVEPGVDVTRIENSCKDVKK